MNKIEGISDEDIVEALKAKYARLQVEITKMQTALEAFGVVNALTTIDVVKGIGVEENIEGAFEVQQVLFLKQCDAPCTSKEMWENHRNRNPQYTSSLKTFSGQLSSKVKSDKSELKQYVLDNTKNKYKYWYGIRDWFIEDQLTEKYRKIMYDKIRALN